MPVFGTFLIFIKTLQGMNDYVLLLWGNSASDINIAYKVLIRNF